MNRSQVEKLGAVQAKNLLRCARYSIQLKKYAYTHAQHEMKKSDLTGQQSEIPSRTDLSQVLARALARNRSGWRFVATVLLTINGIWLLFGIIGYRLAGMIFR